MKKEFIECDEREKSLYSTFTICFNITQCAKSYILESNKINDEIRDNLLVDFINYIAKKNSYDFSLDSNDLYNETYYPDLIKPEILLTIIREYCSEYIFTKFKFDKYNQDFNLNNNALILIDFINYITKKNGYDRIFTIKELYENFKEKEYKLNMKKLREFLLLTDSYGKRLQNGETIDSIFKSMALKYHLENISKKGVYYYTENVRKKYGSMFMSDKDKEAVDEQLYAMSYAYAKSSFNDQKPTKKLIQRKIKKMQKN